MKPHIYAFLVERIPKSSHKYYLLTYLMNQKKMKCFNNFCLTLNTMVFILVTTLPSTPVTHTTSTEGNQY